MSDQLRTLAILIRYLLKFGGNCGFSITSPVSYALFNIDPKFSVLTNFSTLYLFLAITECKRGISVDRVKHRIEGSIQGMESKIP